MNNRFFYYCHFVFVTLLVCALFCGCTKEEATHHAPPLILDKNTVLIEKDNKTLYGTGRVLFNQPLFGLFSKELYSIKTELTGENSSFVLHSHFTGFSKRDGIKVSFIRDKTALIIQTGGPRHPPQELFTDERHFVKNQVLTVRVEVQNGTENFINIRVWNAYTNPTGYLKKRNLYLSQRNLIADSTGSLFYSKGEGMLWGVELNNARLLDIFREPVNQ